MHNASKSPVFRNLDYYTNLCHFIKQLQNTKSVLTHSNVHVSYVAMFEKLRKFKASFDKSPSNGNQYIELAKLSLHSRTTYNSSSPLLKRIY